MRKNTHLINTKHNKSSRLAISNPCFYVMSVFFVLVVRARYIEWKELRKGRKSNSSTISNCSKLHGFCTFFDGSLTSTGKVGRISIVKSISGWRVGVHARLMPTMAASVKQKIQQLFGSRKVPTAKEILRSKVWIPRVPIKQAHTHVTDFFGEACAWRWDWSQNTEAKINSKHWPISAKDRIRLSKFSHPFWILNCQMNFCWSWNPILTNIFFGQKRVKDLTSSFPIPFHLWCVYRHLVDSYGKCK